MLAIQGIYDGSHVKILPFEKLPEVDRNVRVAIVFFEDISSNRNSGFEAAKRMRKLREKMPPLGVGVKELIEAGRGLYIKPELSHTAINFREMSGY